MAYVVGETAVIVPVAEADPVVGRWRSRFDPAATYGVPPHVTVLYPFLPVDRLTADVLDDVRTIAAAEPPFSVTFSRTARFAEVVYLAPEPDVPFRRLTARLAERWPEAPPYAGAFPDPVPHLTVTSGAPPDEADAAEADVTAVCRSRHTSTARH